MCVSNRLEDVNILNQKNCLNYFHTPGGNFLSKLDGKIINLLPITNGWFVMKKNYRILRLLMMYNNPARG